MPGPAKTVRRRVAIATAALALAACGRQAAAPVYSLSDCRRAAVTNAQSGARVIGAEDIAFDAAGKRLIISAYDRRATEKASRGNAPPPQGGVYEIQIDRLFAETQTVRAAPIVQRGPFANGLRPHGLDYSQGQIAFVNRGYVKDGARWRMRPTLVRIDAAGAVASKPAHCAANDVAMVGDSFLATRDHAACDGIARLLENVLGQKRSGAYFDHGAVLINNIAFANGVAVLSDGFAVAATRENAVHLFRASKESGSRQFVAKMPGAPDNLSVATDGDIIAALHPNLLRLALNRSWGIGKAGSRIVRVDVETGAATVLFDDAKGALFSAATVGVETPYGLVAGSVTDTGLLICEKRP